MSRFKMIDNVMHKRKTTRQDGKYVHVWEEVKPVEAVYDENSIRVLTAAEKAMHSTTSILSTLLDEHPDKAPEHLARVAECLVQFGWGISKYEQYLEGTLSSDELSSMQAWFRETNIALRNAEWAQ